MQYRLKKWGFPALIFSIWVAWAWLLLGPAKYKPGFFQPIQENSFAATGSFGDSFGPIAALMTTIAAMAAYVAFTSDREDRARQQFETNFFTLLANFESITGQTEMYFGKKDNKIKYKSEYRPLERLATRKISREFKGRFAIGVVVLLLRERIGPDGYRNIKVVASGYEKIFDSYVNSLGHYFRTLYQVYRLIDERCPRGDADYYARIVRAHLSHSELCLIAYNCIVGEGRHKFKRLAEKYAILHNLHRQGLDEFAQAELDFFRRKLKDGAFRFEDFHPVTFDD